MLLVLNGSAIPDSPSVAVARVLVAQLRTLGHESQLIDLSTDPTPARLFPAKGMVFVVEEQGGSFAGILKTYLDDLTVPEIFAHLPCAFIGVSEGPWGGVRAVEQLELAVHSYGAHLYGTRIFMRQIRDVLDGRGEITDRARVARLQSMMEGFATFVHALALTDPVSEEVDLSQPVPAPQVYTPAVLAEAPYDDVTDGRGAVPEDAEQTQEDPAKRSSETTEVTLPAPQ